MNLLDIRPEVEATNKYATSLWGKGASLVKRLLPPLMLRAGPQISLLPPPRRAVMLGRGVRVRLQGRERQGSAEEGRLEKEAEETQITQKQPQPSPVWGLLGLQHIKEHSCQTLLGPVAATTGADALLLTQEVVLLPFASAVSKGLAEPGHGVVEVPGEHGPAGTGVWRLQTEGREQAVFVAVVTLWGAGHQGAQEDQKGCGEAEPAHLHGLAGGLLMSLLFNMLSSLVIAFLPRSKCLLISWLQSPCAVNLQPKKIKSAAVSIVPPSMCHEVMGLDAMILVFLNVEFSVSFSLFSFTFIKFLWFLLAFWHKGAVFGIK